MDVFPFTFKANYIRIEGRKASSGLLCYFDLNSLSSLSPLLLLLQPPGPESLSPLHPTQPDSGYSMVYVIQPTSLSPSAS